MLYPPRTNSKDKDYSELYKKMWHCRENPVMMGIYELDVTTKRNIRQEKRDEDRYNALKKECAVY